MLLVQFISISWKFRQHNNISNLFTFFMNCILKDTTWFYGFAFHWPLNYARKPNLYNFRWLLAQGRLEEAENIVRKIAKYNGNPLPSDFHLIAPQSDDQQAKKTGETGGIFTFLNLFKTPNMRMKTLIIYYCWFTTSMIYYGLTLNSNNVGGSLFQIYCFGKGTWICTLKVA